MRTVLQTRANRLCVSTRRAVEWLPPNDVQQTNLCTAQGTDISFHSPSSGYGRSSHASPCPEIRECVTRVTPSCGSSGTGHATCSWLSHGLVQDLRATKLTTSMEICSTGRRITWSMSRQRRITSVRNYCACSVPSVAIPNRWAVKSSFQSSANTHLLIPKI